MQRPRDAARRRFEMSTDTPSTHALNTDTPNAEALRRALVRNVDEVVLEHQQRAPLYDTRTGGVTNGTAAKKLGAGYDVLEPGKRACPYHYHLAQEEMFVILEGRGSLRVAGQMVPIRAGDVIVIPPGPEYPHHIINTSDAPLRYLSISTQERPELCCYPDSDKLGAFAKDHSFIGRRATSIDYWEGEP
jgi:uncharacterized cupin superfamily protein